MVIRTLFWFILVCFPAAYAFGVHHAWEEGASEEIAEENVKAKELANKPERLEWLQDAGFGMFVHFSHDSQLGSVISHSLVGASDDYLKRYFYELPKTFHPHRFDAESLVQLAKLAGMEYITFTAKHHSGFCMWNTKTTDFNIMNTPYNNDLLHDFVKACRKYDMPVGLYYSPEDWLHLYERDIMITRVGELPNADTDELYADLIKRQMTELMTQYGQIDLLFLDGMRREGYGEEPARRVAWTLQPNVLITRGAIPTPEQTVPGVPIEEAWEACMTMGTQWQFKPTNESYKSGTRIIEILIETRAKGGALLLNVGPQPDGALPFEQERILREVALWHFVNDEAIHNTRPWVITNEDRIWFTKDKNADTVYAFLTRIPDWQRGARKAFLIQSIEATDDTVIEVLGQSSKWVEYQPNIDAVSQWEQTDEGLRISVVRAQRLYNDSKWPNPIVVKITNARPALNPPIVQTMRATSPSTGRAELYGYVHDMAGAGRAEVGFEYQPYAGFAHAMKAENWTQSKLIPVEAIGQYSITVEGLKSGIYEYRAVIKHPRITIRGDKKQITVK